MTVTPCPKCSSVCDGGRCVSCGYDMTITYHEFVSPEEPTPPTPRGTFACPICGIDTPHSHSDWEILRHQNGGRCPGCVLGLRAWRDAEPSRIAFHRHKGAMHQCTEFVPTGTPEPAPPPTLTERLRAATDDELSASRDNALADLALADRYPHNAHLVPAIRQHLDALRVERLRRRPVDDDATIRCAMCGRECEPVNDSDARVTHCVDCAPTHIHTALPEGYTMEQLIAAGQGDAPRCPKCGGDVGSDAVMGVYWCRDPKCTAFETLVMGAPWTDAAPVPAPVVEPPRICPDCAQTMVPVGLHHPAHVKCVNADCPCEGVFRPATLDGEEDDWATDFANHKIREHAAGAVVEDVRPATGVPDILAQLAADTGGTIDTVGALPDGSGFATMSFPLPSDHWSSVDRDGFNVPPMLMRCGTDNPLHDELVAAVRAAVRYGYRAATMNGRITDLDPDALVQNVVVGLLGYHSPDGLSSDTWANPDAIPALGFQPRP